MRNDRAVIRSTQEYVRADHAGQRGVRLALEPLNRFETSLINTAEQAIEVVDRVSSPALGVLPDTATAPS